MSITKVDSISNKSLFPKKFPFVDHIGRDIVAVKGQVFAYSEIKGKYEEQQGKTILLQGAFVAVNLVTGEVAESGTYLPTKAIGELAKERLKTGELAFDIEVKMSLAASNKNEQGYAWITTPIIPAAALAHHEALKQSFVAAMVPLISSNATPKAAKK